jgi:hypothetical protein
VSSVVAVSSDSEPEDSTAITEAAGKLRHLIASEHKKKLVKSFPFACYTCRFG